MTDWVGHAPKNHMTSLEQWEQKYRDSATRFRALLRRHSAAVPQTLHLGTHAFYGWSGRSRIDFVATPPSVQFSRIFVNFTAGRRLQLIPAGPRDHMPLDDGFGDKSYAGKMGSRKNRRNALRSARLTFFRPLALDEDVQYWNLVQHDV